jgi:Protein of unknown function (DUF2628)
MAKLAIYTNEAGNSVLHRTGFSWMAAIIPPVWALQHRLYRTAIAAFALNAFLIEASALIPAGAPFYGFQIGWLLLQTSVAGFGANLYYGIVLERSGYFVTSAEPGRLKASQP